MILITFLNTWNIIISWSPHRTWMRVCIFIICTINYYGLCWCFLSNCIFCLELNYCDINLIISIEPNMGLNKSKGIWYWFVEYGKEELQDQEKLQEGQNNLLLQQQLLTKIALRNSRNYKRRLFKYIWDPLMKSLRVFRFTETFIHLHEIEILSIRVRNAKHWQNSNKWAWTSRNRKNWNS